MNFLKKQELKNGFMQSPLTNDYSAHSIHEIAKIKAEFLQT